MDRYRILIVDDEMPAREMVKGLIDWEQTRFEIAFEAKNGKEALQLVQNEDIDLIITDMIMPKMNGVELGENIIKDYPDISILYVSGIINRHFVESMIRKNVDSFCEKPVSPDRMINLLESINEKREQSMK